MVASAATAAQYEPQAGREPPLQEGLEHGVAEALHGGEVVRQQPIDEARVHALRARAHAHGPLQHPRAAQARVVAVHSPQRTPVQRIRLQSTQEYSQYFPLDMHCIRASIAVPVLPLAMQLVTTRRTCEHQECCACGCRLTRCKMRRMREVCRLTRMQDGPHAWGLQADKDARWAACVRWVHLQRVRNGAAQAVQVARESTEAAKAERRLDAARVAHLQHARPAGRQRALRAHQAASVK